MEEAQQKIRYWGVVTRGIEPIALQEAGERLADMVAPDLAYRRLVFATGADPADLLDLRTFDDLFIDLGQWQGIGRPRAVLARMGDAAMALDLRDAAALCRAIRDVGTPPSFSVTVNFVGRRNYSTDEIKQVVASGVEAGHGWSYATRDADADLNLRIFIEHEQAYLGLRLAQLPLHERPYKAANLPGSLKPTVAAAMVRLCELRTGETLLDPFCGVGTIPIEAALLGLHALGGDLAQDALEAARANGARAGTDISFETWDARALPLDTGNVDAVACNLPWDRQVAIELENERFYNQALAELARVVRPGGPLVLLTSLGHILERAAEHAGLQIESQIEISLSGQTPRIFVLRSGT